MALRFGKKRATPESDLLKAVTQVLRLKGYLWVKPEMIRLYLPMQMQAIASARGLKGVAWRANTGGASDAHDNFVAFGIPGHPDICVLQISADRKSLRYIGLELKVGKARLRPNQERFHALINSLIAAPSVFTIRAVEDLDGVL